MCEIEASFSDVRAADAHRLQVSAQRVDWSDAIDRGGHTREGERAIVLHWNGDAVGIQAAVVAHAVRVVECQLQSRKLRARDALQFDAATDIDRRRGTQHTFGESGRVEVHVHPGFVDDPGFAGAGVHALRARAQAGYPQCDWSVTG